MLRNHLDYQLNMQFQLLFVQQRTPSVGRRALRCCGRVYLSRFDPAGRACQSCREVSASLIHCQSVGPADHLPQLRKAKGPK